MHRWRALVKGFRAVRFSAQERAAETVEYIGVGVVVLALLLAVGSVMRTSGGQQIGGAIVDALKCWISFKTDCPAAAEVAKPPPTVLEPDTGDDGQIYDVALSVPEVFRLWTGDVLRLGEGLLSPPAESRRFPLERNWDGTFAINGKYQGECLQR